MPGVRVGLLSRECVDLGALDGTAGHVDHTPLEVDSRFEDDVMGDGLFGHLQALPRERRKSQRTHFERVRSQLETVELVDSVRAGEGRRGDVRLALRLLDDLHASRAQSRSRHRCAVRADNPARR